MLKNVIILCLLLLVYSFESGCIRQKCEYQIIDCAHDKNCKPQLRECQGVSRKSRKPEDFNNCVSLNENAKKLWEQMLK
ncbi:hypothetical protein pb186bvf_016949 [Paramecium bursaria]